MLRSLALGILKVLKSSAVWSVLCLKSIFGQQVLNNWKFSLHIINQIHPRAFLSAPQGDHKLRWLPDHLSGITCPPPPKRDHKLLGSSDRIHPRASCPHRREIINCKISRSEGRRVQRNRFFYVPSADEVLGSWNRVDFLDIILSGSFNHRVQGGQLVPEAYSIPSHTGLCCKLI